MIHIYTMEKCKHCIKLKAYLQSRNIEYKEIDLSKKENRKARETFRKKGYKVVPILEDGDVVISGYNKDLLDELL